jgi:GNAT superfamily N-acetyltransferase
VLAACYRGLEPFLRLTATFEASELHEQPGSLAALSPAIPLSSIFNSMIFDRERPDSLEQALDALWPLYEHSPVQRWAAWIVEGDTAAEAIAARRGLTIDSSPRAMGVELDGLRLPPAPEHVDQRWDMPVAAELNERAYGVPRGLFGAAAIAPQPAGARCFVAEQDGAAAAVVISLPNEDDCAIVWVACDPAMQRKGRAGAALAAALRAAREDGFASCTLQSSPAGYELYRRAGFNDLGVAVNLWQHMRFS